MTRHLVVEWGPAGIRVNGIDPGPVADTEGTRRLVGAGFKEKIEAEVSLGRFAQIPEVCDAAKFISGEILVVDGGAWMTAGSLSAS
jgi:NAD(P)-dependent dehydrogenase (short-subunit alcohol dehydrogenase family)